MSNVYQFETPSALKYVHLTMSGQITQLQTEQFQEYYAFWKKLWIQTLTENKVDSTMLRADDFLRQDSISVILKNNDIAGMIFNSFYKLDLKVHQDTKYFVDNIRPDIIALLKNQEIKTVCSLEYLGVDPNWRSKSDNISISSILMGLSSKIALEGKADACIATTRMDRSVHKTFAEFGAINIGPEFSKYNTPVVTQCLFPQNWKNHTDDKVNAYIEQFYSQQNSKLHKAG